MPAAVLCLASYEKGHEFLREAKRQGATVYLVTSASLQHHAHWPMESIDEIFYLPDENKKWDLQGMLYGVSYLARTRPIDRIVALDDFDLEKAALLREHLRTPGMGESATRYFRDKLAMRMAARDHGLLVPEFVPIFHHGRVAEFLARVRPPWVLKPRSLAGAIGIRKLHEPRAVWEQVEQLGDQQSFYLLEQFVPGEVYHCDSLIYEGQIQFACVSRYGAPPMQVSHEGGVFTTRWWSVAPPRSGRFWK